MATALAVTTPRAIHAAADRAVQQLGYSSIKSEQLRVVVGVVEGRDVFAVLPTGYGKSLCYACLPLVFDQLQSSGDPSIVLVVTPLTAIMEDQLTSLSDRGLKVCCVNSDLNDDSIKKRVLLGEYQLLLFTPEMLLDKKCWRKMLCSDIYSQRMRAFVIDEAHTVKKWGETFRKVLLRVNEVRSLLPQATKMLALTATATTSLRLDVSRILGMNDPLVVALSPCKSNIIFSVVPFKTDMFQPMIERLRTEKLSFPRTIIYCRRFSDCADLYSLFRNQLGFDFTEPPNSPDVPAARCVDMYMSCTDPVVKEGIVSRFTKESNLRIVIATVAFGMGIDCPNVRQVIHYGPPSDIESYVQETGRAGRDRVTAHAVLVKYNVSRKYIDTNIANYMSNMSICRRDQLFKHFDEYKKIPLSTLCLCCDICAKECTCHACHHNHHSFD